MRIEETTVPGPRTCCSWSGGTADVVDVRLHFRRAYSRSSVPFWGSYRALMSKDKTRVLQPQWERGAVEDS
jgi:hypothetical protein